MKRRILASGNSGRLARIAWIQASLLFLERGQDFEIA